MGATPHKWAHPASLRSLSGLSPAVTSRNGGGVHADAVDGEELRAGGSDQLAEQLVEISLLLVEDEHPAAQGAHGRLGGEDDRIGSPAEAQGGRVGSELGRGQAVKALPHLSVGDNDSASSAASPCTCAEPLFADDATARLHRVSNGLPRALNNAATAAVIAAAGTSKDLVDDACAKKAAAELTKE